MWFALHMAHQKLLHFWATAFHQVSLKVTGVQIWHVDITEYWAQNSSYIIVYLSLHWYFSCLLWAVLVQ